MLPVLCLVFLFHDTDLQVLQNMHASVFVYRTKLILLPHQLHQLHDYCSEWVAYLYSSLLWMCSLYYILSFLPLTGTQGSFKKIRQQHVWHETVLWDCRFKHVISTCRLCHGTAMSGYHKYVRLKMDGLLEPWQTLKYEVCCDFCVWCVLHQ